MLLTYLFYSDLVSWVKVVFMKKLFNSSPFGEYSFFLIHGSSDWTYAIQFKDNI